VTTFWSAAILRRFPFPFCVARLGGAILGEKKKNKTKAAKNRIAWKLRTNDLSVHYLVHYVFQSVCGVQSSEQASPNALSSSPCEESPHSKGLVVMAEPRKVVPVLLVVAAFSRHDELLARAQSCLEEVHGPVALASPVYAFTQTAYYEATMGVDLRKQLWAFRDLIAGERLPEIKLATNALEQTLGEGYAETRPINLDPGYLVLGKFVLATTKDQAHRLYLRDAIYAEVTLQYRAGAFQPWPWTYADYRLPEVIAFLGEAREYYRQALTAP
jgi:hypothetical protein